MKKLFVKRGAGAIALAAVLGLVAFVACEQPTDSDPAPAPVEKGQGVVGQVSGVVYDSVTGAPIAGIAVGIAEYADEEEAAKEQKPATKIVTNESGSYHFKD